MSVNRQREPEGITIMSINGKKLMIFFALMFALTVVLPENPARAEKTGTVTGGWLILRDAPSFSGKILSSYPSGTVVQITGEKGSWYAVTAPDGLTGFMLGEYLTITEENNIAPERTAYVTSANGLNVRLRSGPGKVYSIIASFAPGTSCVILSAGKNWCRIRIGTYTGYMMTRFLTSEPVITIQPQPVPPDQYTVYVTSGNGLGVNLRSGPGKNYSCIGFYSVGTPAVMIRKGITWSYILIGNRYGYMMTQFLTESKPVHPIIPDGGACVVSANGKNVNLRAAPTTAARIIRSFKVGTKLTIITRGREWCFIEIEGYFGYMMKQFIYEGNMPATPTDLHAE